MLMGNNHCAKHGIERCKECLGAAQAAILANNKQYQSQTIYGNVSLPEEAFLDENITYHMPLDKYKEMKLVKE